MPVGALAGFIGFQNWRMAPCPDPKGLPRPKLSLELALAMLRLAPWLVYSGFKTDGWPPVPIPKGSPDPNCRWSWLLPRCGSPPGWFYRVSKLTDGPRSRSQRRPQAQNVFGAGFSHAAAGALATFIGFQNWRMAACPFQRRPQAGTLAGFIGFQNWRMAPGPDPKGLPTPKM